jgi:hypothetical protein
MCTARYLTTSLGSIQHSVQSQLTDSFVAYLTILNKLKRLRSVNRGVRKTMYYESERMKWKERINVYDYSQHRRPHCTVILNRYSGTIILRLLEIETLDYRL